MFGCCSSVAEHWQLKPGVPGQFLATDSLFTFLHLLTSKSLPMIFSTVTRFVAAENQTRTGVVPPGCMYYVQEVLVCPVVC